MMTNEKLTQMVLNHEKRISILEGTEQPIEPPVPIPPIDPPLIPYDYEIDMSRAYHIDFLLKEDEEKIFMFKFSNTTSNLNSYVHFTAVQLGSGGCLEMSIPDYGYKQSKCRVETSEGIATDGLHTNWVVGKNTRSISSHLIIGNVT